MSIKIINLAGPGMVGKSTTAKKMTKIFSVLYPELNVDHMAFADPIYNVTSYLTGIPVDTLKNPEYKETKWTSDTTPMQCLVNWSPRNFLQKVGTECFRHNIDNNFWVEAVIRQAILKNLDVVVMEDARFPNEFEVGDINIELKRDGVEYACNHESAMPPDEKYIDFVIKLYPDIKLELYVDKIFNMIEDKKCGM